jgi:chromosome segregation ATPase
MGALRAALEAHRGALDTQRDAAEALRKARELREKRRARLASLREVIERREDLSAAARHLLDDPADHGIRSLVRDAIEVPRELEEAVGAVLAERADALVVATPEGALNAVEALRRARAGRGAFVVELSAEPGSHGIVPLGESLLGRVRGKCCACTGADAFPPRSSLARATCSHPTA